MKRVLFVFAVVAASVVALGAQKQKPPKPAPVPVFVTSVGARNGMTDPNQDNQNSVKDLRKAVDNAGKKVLVTVDKREDATVVLVVIGRDGAKMNPRAGQGLPRLRVNLVFKDSEMEMSSISKVGFGAAANGIADQVEAWVIANRAKLTEPVK